MAKGGKRKASNIVVWILLGLLVVGLAGFGIGDFGGSVRSVGTVGDEEIETQDYALALQSQLAQLQRQTGQSLSMAEARSFGLDRMVLESLVTTAALDNEAQRIGLSVGDAVVRKQIVSLPAFQGIDGNFDREAYEFTLDRNGLTPRDFEEQIREEEARELLRRAVAAGAAPPSGHAETLAAWLGEERRFDWARLGPEMLEDPLPEPTQAELEEWHAENPEPFTAPETREITYVWLTPDMLLEQMEIDEAALRALYESREAEFNQPERRLVERLAFRDMAAAEAARAALAAGETSFDALVEERGLTLDDVDLGEVARGDLPSAADEAVFTLSEPGIAGPVETSLGPVLFRVNAVLNAQTVSFEEVRDELARDFAADRARRQIDDSMDDIEDLLAGGATLEEVAAETPMDLGTISYDGESVEGLAAHDAFRLAAQQTRTGDFPELQSLPDGGIFALRVDEVTPPRLRPLDQVRDAVAEDWRTARTAERLRALAEEMRTQIIAGTSFEALDLLARSAGPMTRNAPDEDAPGAVIERAFALGAGAVGIADDGEIFHLVRVTEVIPADLSLPDTRELIDAIRARQRADLAEDAFALFTRALREETPITLNPTALNAIHAQFQ